MGRPQRTETDYPTHITREGKRYIFDKRRIADSRREANTLRRRLQREAKKQKRHNLISGYRVLPPKKRLIRREGKRGGYEPGYIVLKYVRR